MPITSTSMKKGERKTGRSKGTPNKRTALKKAVGVDNWDQLKEWLEKDGIQKATAELQKLKGKDFIYAYEALLEYVKPKLQRTTIEGDPNKPLAHVDLSGLSFEQLKELINAG